MRKRIVNCWPQWCTSHIAIILGFLPVTAGCGNSQPVMRVLVSGQVSFQGKSITDGTIRFVPIGNTSGPIVSTAIVNGEYRFEQENAPVIGKYRVEIQGYRKTGQVAPDLTSANRNKSERGLVEQKLPFVPDKFNSRSNLEANVTGEATELNFDL